MASFNKYQVFVADIANKVHNLGSDQLVVALKDSAPSASDSTLTGEISYTNLSSRNITTTSSTQTSGTYKLVLTDLVLTASGTVPQFRYVILYNSTASKLIGWYDYGSEVNLLSGDTFTVDFDGSAGVITIT